MVGLQAAHTVLAPAGPQAAAIARLWWVMLVTVSAVFAVVVLAIAVAVARGAIRRRRVASPRAAQAPSESALTNVVAAAAALTVVILFVLLIFSIYTGRAVASVGASSAVSIAVTGHQWWWEIEYEDATPSRRLITANEIHIPIGRPVVFKITSHDVIHSFWAPNLHGKRDLVPGILNTIWLQADRPGVYRGQCAEFCGRQHAHMAFDIVAEPDVEFERWLDAQRAPAHEPQNDAQTRGRAVFLGRTCSSCHSIRGTPAFGRVGPDLTHLASRGTLAAGTLPNSRGHLAGWIVDPQTIKPGSQMPPNLLASDDLQDVLSYLEQLK
jgi:cytochrome c oxidase subunit 2